MKIFPDYTSQLNKKDTLKYINKFKIYFRDFFEKEMSLLEIEPNVVVNDISYITNEREINFDNFEEMNILTINPWTNNYLMKLMKELDIGINEGLYSYYYVINRDVEYSHSTTSYEYIYNIQYRTLMTNINVDFFDVKIKQVIEKINNCEIIKELKKQIIKPKVINASKIKKQFPLLSKDEILLELCSKHKSVLIFENNDSSKSNVKFAKNKIGIYGQIVATLYLYNENSNSILKVLTVYSIPTKDDLIKQIQDNELKFENFRELEENLMQASDQIGIEFYFSSFLVYVLNKFTINEIVSSPNNYELNNENKDIIM